MASATLDAQPREGRGKGAARRLRREGRVPAIVYGHGDETRSLSLSAHELDKLLHTISVENTVVSLATGRGAPIDVLIRSVQKDPVKANVLHVDFVQLHAGEPIKLQVPIRLHGTPAGVYEQSGVLDQAIHDLDIECLPRDIPEAVDVDVSELRIGASVRVHDLPLPPNINVLVDGELAVASVIAPRGATLEAEPVAEGGVGGTVEPELLRDDARGGTTEE